VWFSLFARGLLPQQIRSGKTAIGRGARRLTRSAGTASLAEVNRSCPSVRPTRPNRLCYKKSSSHYSKEVVSSRLGYSRY